MLYDGNGAQPNWIISCFQFLEHKEEVKTLLSQQKLVMLESTHMVVERNIDPTWTNGKPWPGAIAKISPLLWQKIGPSTFSFNISVLYTKKGKILNMKWPIIHRSSKWATYMQHVYKEVFQSNYTKFLLLLICLYELQSCNLISA